MTTKTLPADKADLSYPVAAAVHDRPILDGFREAVQAAGLSGRTTLADLLQHAYDQGRTDQAK